MTEAKVAVTIRQVAEEAGVSIGTVDRILHHRGRVSKETTDRVHEIIEKLGYKPNIHASLLSIRKVIRILYYLRDYSKNFGKIRNNI